MKNILLIGLLLFCINCGWFSDDTGMVVMEIKDNWQFRKVGEDRWYPASVPGTVHTDLINNGLIPDPFFRDNEEKVQWVEKEDWEYHTRFEVDKKLLKNENIYLTFHGLDTYAKIYLNDVPVLETHNMFRQWRVDVRNFLDEGKNSLRVLFRSPIDAAAPHWQALGYELPGGPQVMTRKAPYHYGWDWGPRLVTTGIWRPVVLEAWDHLSLEEFQVAQEEINEDHARLTAYFETTVSETEEARLSVWDEDTGKEIAHSSVTLVPGANRVSFSFRIPNPRLWWTNGLGKPGMYRLKGVVKAGGTTREMSRRIGLRTIEVVAEKDDKGESFYFKLNGKPLFIKGANYIPQDSFVTRVTKERYEQLIHNAVEARMNMLRVWGGGIYENDIFYDLCDEKGILVWQDFMFACAMYPGHKEFLDNVRREAVDNVKRLRHHPCIALWCGNNEIFEAWHRWGWQKPFTPEQRDRIWEDYRRIFYDILPSVVTRYDTGRYYWPGSPKFGRGNPRSASEGDAHYWGVWHDAEPFGVLNEKTGRFMSEFGFQAFPSMETIAGFTEPGDRAVESPVMGVHQKHPRGNQLIRTYMQREYVVPKDFEKFVYLSQVVQARGIRLGLEAQRRAKPFCMGSLYWQFNDCWPVVSWSSLDYHGNWKGLHYAARRAYADVLVSPVVEEKELRVYIVSDLPEPIEGKLRVRLLDFRGKALWLSEVNCKIPENSSRFYFGMDIVRLLKGLDAKGVVLEAVLRSGESEIASNYYYFYPPRYLKLTDPTITAQVSRNEQGIEVRLRSVSLARDVYLSVPGIQGRFTHNFFDMLPGREYVVQLLTKEHPDLIRQKLKILSLYDLSF